ncbi:MAG: phytoene desaturase family protein [Clostridium sp.]
MKKIVIIGGGVAGLSAGIYAQKKGYKSIILEKHKIVGGQCTGWNRQGYHIDGCIHWLTGTKEGTLLNKMWKEVGALDGIEIYQPNTFTVFSYQDYKIPVYRDLNKFRETLLELSPEDGEEINDLCEAISQMHNLDMATEKPMDRMNVWDMFKAYRGNKPMIRVMKDYGKISGEELSKRFKHPAISELLRSMLPDGLSASSTIFALGIFTDGNGGIPMGGSKELAIRMEKKYLSLGGEIKKNSEALEILIDGEIARGVLLENGEEIKGDYIVPACDAYVTFKNLLKGKYDDKNFEERYKNVDSYKIPTCMLISFGIEKDLSTFERTYSFEVDPFVINDINITRLSFANYSYEKGFAPEGKTIGITLLSQEGNSDYEYWNNLYEDKKKYDEEKHRIGLEVLFRIEKEFPELRGQLKLLDITTPVTYNRYLNSYLGSYMSFMNTTSGKMMNYNGRIKNLKNVFLAGQWVQPPGGLPVALTTGRDAIFRICEEDK